MTVLANVKATVQLTAQGQKGLHPFEDKNQDAEDSGCSSSFQHFFTV